MSEAPDPLASFVGGVTRVKTMADGSPRFEFEAGEAAIAVMQSLAEAQANPCQTPQDCNRDQGASLPLGGCERDKRL